VTLYPIPNGAGNFPITRGQVVTVLPFGNFDVKATVTGPQLKQLLENGVSMSVNPVTLAFSAQGRFPQVSGLCFTYDVAASSGSRVTGAVRAWERFVKVAPTAEDRARVQKLIADAKAGSPGK